MIIGEDETANRNIENNITIRFFPKDINLGVLMSIVCSLHVCDECTTRYPYDESVVYGTGWWGGRETPPSPG